MLAALSAGAAPATVPSSQPDPAAERLTFLTLQLSSVEESIKAVNAAMRAAGYKASVAADKAQNYEKGNELMDRKGGGPVPWDEFYGKTARDFIARNTIEESASSDKYHRKVSIAASWGNSPLRRPAQFDYLYRANAEQAARAKDSVAAMGKKIDALLARRRQLEAEQVSLWATIALEAVGSREFGFRPLYRFKLKTDGSKPAPAAASEGRVNLLRAAALYLRTADRAAEQAAQRIGTDPDGALRALADTIQSADSTLRESAFMAAGAAAAEGPQDQQAKDLMAISKRMVLLSRNLTDALRLAREGDAAGDEPRKQTFRGQIQGALLGLASSMSEFDDSTMSLAEAWGIVPEAGVENPDKLPNIRAEATPAKPPTIATVTPPAPTTPAVVQPPPPQQPGAQNPAPAGATALTQTDIAQYAFGTNTALVVRGKPYVISGQITPAPKAKNGVQLIVGPGVEVRGGTIDLKREGRLVIAGTASEPAILRGVHLHQGNGSFMKAQYAIFDNCSFAKTGQWFSTYSSKWAFDECVLYKCRLYKLSEVDYGVQLRNTTLVSMVVPEMTNRRPKRGEFDHMQHLRHNWRIVDTCHFIDCRIPPTVFWAGVRCDYSHCNFVPGEAFESPKAAETVAYVEDTDGESPVEVFSRTPPKKAIMEIHLAAEPFEIFHLPSIPAPEIAEDPMLKKYVRTVGGAGGNP